MLPALVRGARDGDEQCWDALVDRFSGLIWSVARGFGMSTADAAELSQIIWLRVAEHLHRIENPERLGAWLVTTTRRECFRQRRLRDRDVLVEGDSFEWFGPSGPAVDSRMLADERDNALWRAFSQLPERSRTLLAMLMTDPPIPYCDIAETLDMPIGSIGPTRSRLLATLRRQLQAIGVTASD
jgi:RNA polymerase sigma factor (sigma-70 family)